MQVFSRSVGESVMIQDVQLRVEQITGSTITLSMEKLTGGQRTLVHAFKGQQLEICYNVIAMVISVNASQVMLGFEAPDEILVSLL